jgi:hypothetical protein
MLKNIVYPKRETAIMYELAFDDGHHNGYGFPCDSHGNLLPGLADEAKQNYAFCMAHPELFARYNAVIKYSRTYTEPGHGTCACGSEVELVDLYYGSCQCGNCGRWYDIFGGEIFPPDQWEDDDDLDEYSCLNELY